MLAGFGRKTEARLEAHPFTERLPAQGLAMFALRGFLSPAECEALVALIDAGAAPSTALRPADEPERRNSATCQLSSDEPLVAEVEGRMARLLDLPPRHDEKVQGQRYHAGQHFAVHNDYFAGGEPYSEAVASEGGQRTWTAMVYLKSPEEGGETVFPWAGLQVSPVAGTLLTWNNMDAAGQPNGYAHHAALPVVRGTKHVLTKWFRERPWQGDAVSAAFRA